MIVTRALLSVFLVAVAARNAAAQCPDGTPPPCPQIARPAAREAARAPDPNRITVLPFRVTTADTLLGEGFAELLATEFTGEGGPRAVDMATVLSAWRRAGGGLRTPLARAEAVRVARELGAGLVSEGSIVGLGGRVTVTASLIGVPDGSARGGSTRVSGSPDSLDALLRQTATGLLAAVGGQLRGTEGTRFTDSPVAMRHYLEGLSAWRRGRLGEAVQTFDRALAEDSGFAQAMFRRYMGANWGVGSGNAPYARLAWERRGRLSPQERTVLEGILGSQYPRPRLVEERFADRQRAVNQLPDSPDALYILGDYYYHYGAAVDPVNQLSRAQESLERAAAADSQATVLRHLIEIGVRTRDTALLRRVWPAYDRTDDIGKWAGGWLVAASTGDQALLAALRRRPIQGAGSFGGLWGAGTAAVADIPVRLLDELFDRWLAATQGDMNAWLRQARGVVLAVRGRPAAAERAWSGLPSAPENAADVSRVQLAIMGAAAGFDVGTSVRRLAAAGDGPSADSAAVATSRCLAALWSLHRGDSIDVDESRFTRQAPRCMWAINLVRATASDAAPGRLAAADSALRNTLGFDVSGFEGLLLARAWEARSDLPRALAAVRLRVFGGGFADACCWREEGRLAALAGDTAGAIRAYRTYLVLHRDAEPALVPQRDSVQAELARLERRP